MRTTLQGKIPRSLCAPVASRLSSWLIIVSLKVCQWLERAGMAPQNESIKLLRKYRQMFLTNWTTQDGQNESIVYCSDALYQYIPSARFLIASLAHTANKGIITCWGGVLLHRLASIFKVRSFLGHLRHMFPFTGKPRLPSLRSLRLKGSVRTHKEACQHPLSHVCCCEWTGKLLETWASGTSGKCCKDKS